MNSGALIVSSIGLSILFPSLSSKVTGPLPISQASNSATLDPAGSLTKKVPPLSNSKGSLFLIL